MFCNILLLTQNTLGKRYTFYFSGDIYQTRGFQANSILQLHPPAAVTCCVLQADWGLVAAGTAHGLALLDYIKNKPVMVKCTLNPNGKDPSLRWQKKYFHKISFQISPVQAIRQFPAESHSKNHSGSLSEGWGRAVQHGGTPIRMTNSNRLLRLRQGNRPAPMRHSTLLTPSQSKDK